MGSVVYLTCNLIALAFLAIYGFILFPTDVSEGTIGWAYCLPIAAVVFLYGRGVRSALNS